LFSKAALAYIGLTIVMYKTAVYTQRNDGMQKVTQWKQWSQKRW